MGLSPLPVKAAPLRQEDSRLRYHPDPIALIKAAKGKAIKVNPDDERTTEATHTRVEIPQRLREEQRSVNMAATIVNTPSSGTTHRSSSIVHKPARGWLHPDHLFAKDGINYNVRVSLLFVISLCWNENPPNLSHLPHDYFVHLFSTLVVWR